MKLTKLSYHMTADHIERTTEILMTVGLGDEIFRRRWTDKWGRDCIRSITTTGVMICYAPEDETVITVFVPTLKQVRQLFRTNHCPEYLFNVCEKNQRRFKHLQYSDIY